MEKTVLITGATAGIGQACAKIFASNKYKLILTGRRSERLESLKNELQQQYQVEIITLNFDVRDKNQVETAIDSLPETWKAIDILINNAGLAAGLDPIQSGDIDDWERMIDTNLKGLLYMSRKVSPLMTARKSGHIINISSIAGKEVYPNGNVYCATKHAVSALTRGMRIDLLPYGIKVSAICPGMVETEFSVVRFHGDEDKAGKVYDGLTPLSAMDIAETIYFMATRPAHVNLDDVVIMPTAQGSSRDTFRN
ncbi:MAG: SDR family oxidoreductase [Bacteroidota bacterium]|nr:SDR family oxidoreductase [Bacteroidota bacterium]